MLCTPHPIPPETWGDHAGRQSVADHHLYTTASLLDAENRLFAAGRQTGNPAVSVTTVAAVAEQNLPGRDHAMSLDQALAVEKIATSRRQLDVLVGPAGTGKSTTMAGLQSRVGGRARAAERRGLGPISSRRRGARRGVGNQTPRTPPSGCTSSAKPVIGGPNWPISRPDSPPIPPISLPPSLQVRARNLREAIDRWEFRPGQLVIVDEASLAGTFALDELVDAANGGGAKVILVGDPYQLSAIEAGGMFRALVRDRGDVVPELGDIRRFTNGWEKTASVELRIGAASAIDFYQVHNRITAGSRDELVDAIYLAWKTDTESGRVLGDDRR